MYTAAGSGLIRAWDVESHHVQWRTLLNELVRLRRKRWCKSVFCRAYFFPFPRVLSAPPTLHTAPFLNMYLQQDGKPTSLAIGPVDNSVAIGTQAGFVILLEPSGKRAMRESDKRATKRESWLEQLVTDGPRLADLDTLPLMLAPPATTTERVVVNEPVSAVLYSRSGTQLAVGTSTGTVAVRCLCTVSPHVVPPQLSLPLPVLWFQIYDVTDAYGLVGTIDVSNMAVLHLDWSVDGTLVQATTSSLTTYVAVDELSVATASHVAKASWTYHASPIGV